MNTANQVKNLSVQILLPTEKTPGSASTRGSIKSRALLIGHTFVSQLSASKLSDIESVAEICVEGFSGIDAKTLEERLKSYQLKMKEIDIEFLDVVSFDICVSQCIVNKQM